MDPGYSGPWHAHVDPASGSTYYAHAETGETTWTRPAEMDAAATAAAPAPTPATPSSRGPPPLPASVAAATPAAAPAPPAAAEPEAAASEPATDASIIDVPGTDWSQVLDANTGKYYYANKVTYEVNWDTPPEVAAAQAAQLTTSTPLQQTSVAEDSTAIAAATPASQHHHRGSINAYAAPSQDFGIEHDFHRVLDAAGTGLFYYVHKTTSAVQWDVPESWKKVQALEANVNQSIPLPPANNRANFGTSPASLAPINERRISLNTGAGGGGHGPSKSWAQDPQSDGHQAQFSTPQRPHTMRAGDAGESFGSPAPGMQRKMSASGRLPPPLPGSTPLSPSSSVSSPFMSPAATPKQGDSAGPPPLTALAPHAPMPTLIQNTHAGPPGGAQQYGPDGKPVQLLASIGDEIRNFALKGFATEHFRTFKKKTGIISKTAVDVSEVLSWQKKVIEKSLLQSSKKYSSEAVALFKKILAFMGDAGLDASKKSPSLLAAEIVAVGIKNAPLRDELYCQLAKQTKANPEPLSTAQGWKLLVLCCATFAPTRGFQEYLMNYFAANANAASGASAPGSSASASSASSLSAANASAASESVPSILSRYCSWRVLKTIKEGADEKLTLAMVDEMCVRGVRSYQVLFPASLDYLMHLQVAERNQTSTTVPEIIVRMCDAIRANGGFQAKGIFRIAAQREHIHAARARIESGKWDLPLNHGSSGSDPHTPADVLKVWLRELLTPVVPMALYDQALKISESEVECERFVETQLSPVHFATMDYLLHFLAELATHQKETSMNEENLAIGQKTGRKGGREREREGMRAAAADVEQHTQPPRALCRGVLFVLCFSVLSRSASFRHQGSHDHLQKQCAGEEFRTTTHHRVGEETSGGCSAITASALHSPLPAVDAPLSHTHSFASPHCAAASIVTPTLHLAIALSLSLHTPSHLASSLFAALAVRPFLALVTIHSCTHCVVLQTVRSRARVNSSSSSLIEEPGRGQLNSKAISMQMLAPVCGLCLASETNRERNRATPRRCVSVEGETRELAREWMGREVAAAHDSANDSWRGREESAEVSCGCFDAGSITESDLRIDLQVQFLFLRCARSQCRGRITHRAGRHEGSAQVRQLHRRLPLEAHSGARGLLDRARGQEMRIRADHTRTSGTLTARHTGVRCCV